MATFPKTREQLLDESMFVYVGPVTDVREQEVPAGDGTNVLFEADMDVEEVEKALLGAGEERPTLHYWRAGKREPGWSGDTGQHSPLQPGTRIRAFVTYDAEGKAQLLDPNGWEPA